MYKLKYIIILFLLLGISLNGASFAQSKKLLLKKVYFDNQITFYCSNPYELKRVDNKEKSLIVRDDKFYSPRNAFTKSGKVNERTERVEWEHIMPAENFGRQLPCWRNGGRKACGKDDTFRVMESDMYNLVPSIGEVNGDRSNYRYGADKPKIGQYGNCNFQVDFEANRAYIKDDIKGDIARVYFYMSKKYNINLSDQERKMMEAWNKQDPVSEWERIKNDRVEKLQGNRNEFVDYK